MPTSLPDRYQPPPVVTDPSPSAAKAELRIAMRALRDELTVEQRAELSTAVAEAVLALPEALTAKCWFVYVSYRSEVETHELIRWLLGAGRTVCVPDVRSDEMGASEIAAWEHLSPGRFGILAATTHREPAAPIDVCLLPGLAFTLRGERLGYGKAHYDRFLARHPGILKIGLAFDEQVVASLPIEPTDRRLDAIVTPTRVLRCD